MVGAQTKHYRLPQRSPANEEYETSPYKVEEMRQIMGSFLTNLLFFGAQNHMNVLL